MSISAVVRGIDKGIRLNSYTYRNKTLSSNTDLFLISANIIR